MMKKRLKRRPRRRHERHEDDVFLPPPHHRQQQQQQQREDDSWMSVGSAVDLTMLQANMSMLRAKMVLDDPLGGGKPLPVNIHYTAPTAKMLSINHVPRQPPPSYASGRSEFANVTAASGWGDLDFSQMSNSALTRPPPTESRHHDDFSLNLGVSTIGDVVRQERALANQVPNLVRSGFESALTTAMKSTIDSWDSGHHERGTLRGEAGARVPVPRPRSALPLIHRKNGADGAITPNRLRRPKTAQASYASAATSLGGDEHIFCASEEIVRLTIRRHEQERRRNAARLIQVSWCRWRSRELIRTFTATRLQREFRRKILAGYTVREQLADRARHCFAQRRIIIIVHRWRKWASKMCGLRRQIFESHQQRRLRRRLLAWQHHARLRAVMRRALHTQKYKARRWNFKLWKLITRRERRRLNKLYDVTASWQFYVMLHRTIYGLWARFTLTIRQGVAAILLQRVIRGYQGRRFIRAARAVQRLMVRAYGRAIAKARMRADVRRMVAENSTVGKIVERAVAALREYLSTEDGAINFRKLCRKLKRRDKEKRKKLRKALRRKMVTIEQARQKAMEDVFVKHEIFDAGRGVPPDQLKPLLADFGFSGIGARRLASVKKYFKGRLNVHGNIPYKQFADWHQDCVKFRRPPPGPTVTGPVSAGELELPFGMEEKLNPNLTAFLVRVGDRLPLAVSERLMAPTTLEKQKQLMSGAALLDSRRGYLLGPAPIISKALLVSRRAVGLQYKAEARRVLHERCKHEATLLALENFRQSQPPRFWCTVCNASFGFQHSLHMHQQHECQSHAFDSYTWKLSERIATGALKSIRAIYYSKKQTASKRQRGVGETAQKRQISLARTYNPSDSEEDDHDGSSGGSSGSSSGEDSGGERESASSHQQQQHQTNKMSSSSRRKKKQSSAKQDRPESFDAASHRLGQQRKRELAAALVTMGGATTTGPPPR